MGHSDFDALVKASGSSSLRDPKLAKFLNEHDELRELREDFVWPTKGSVGGNKELVNGDDRAIYLCGNSLGLMPKRSKELMQQEMETWSQKAVLGWEESPFDRPWLDQHEMVTARLAKLLGAKTEEVACMQTLTVNLHLLMAVFYKPTAKRYKILFEEKCFPSDRYMFITQAQHNGLDPADALIPLKPRQGEFHLRIEDILETIEKQGDSINVILFPGIQYYTGQVFDMERITKAGRAKGCTVGWDLAHAIGNVPMQLHQWNADFACFCTYKFLNSGPGGVGGLWIHEDHTSRPHLAGWFGQRPAIQFQMGPVIDPAPGAPGWQISTPSPFLMMSLLGSLEVFGKAGGDVTRLRAKSSRLTGYLDALLRSSRFYVPPSSAFDKADQRVRFTIITPEDRAVQLSLLFLPCESGVMEAVFDALIARGVVGDKRKPDVIRISPVPLYNNFEDVRQAVEILESAMVSEEQRKAGHRTNGVNGHA